MGRVVSESLVPAVLPVVQANVSVDMGYVPDVFYRRAIRDPGRCMKTTTRGQRCGNQASRRTRRGVILCRVHADHWALEKDPVAGEVDP